MTDVQDVAAAPAELRSRVEAFLYHEAELLDQWRLDEWLELFTEDARYEVPSTDLPGGDLRVNLGFISDNMHRLRARVRRLNSRFAHREFPTSRTRRQVNNVQIGIAGDSLVVRSVLVMHRFRAGETATYVGVARHTLIDQGAEGFTIRHRRVELDLESLNPHGAVSTIL
jgi:p-cumate 2,3-dioxygenase beta subunit